MSTYKSVSQRAKDTINNLLADFVIAKGDPTVIVPLDHIDNGTIAAFVKKGYDGGYIAVQRDQNVIAEQLAHARENFGDAPYRIVNNDICKDFVRVASTWIYPYPSVDLYNFDLFGTFWGEPVLLVEALYKNPVGVTSKGTLVAFTFQGIANGNICNKLKNLDGWKDRIRIYGEMKGWKSKEIGQYYIGEMKKVLGRDRPACITVCPVILGVDLEVSFENTIVYGNGVANTSTMCFMLYEFFHDDKCTHLVEKEVVEKQSATKRKREISTAAEIVEFEHEVCDLEEDEETEAVEQPSKLVRVDSDSSDSDDGNVSDAMSVGDESVPVSSDDDDEDTPKLEESDDEEDSETENDQEEDEEMQSLNSGDETFDMTCVPSLSDQQGDMSHMDLFPHQLAMVEAVDRTQERGYVKAICGCGKSLAIVTCCKKVTTSVIFVPYKILVEQFGNQYFDGDDTVDCHRVNSDHLGSIALPKAGRRTVYVANFDSAHRIVGLEQKFDLICWDEAHLTTSKKRRASLNDDCETIDVSQLRLEATKHIFWTATPNRPMKQLKSIYGEQIFSYSFSDAVKDKVIKSFALFISCYKDDSGLDDTAGRKFEKIVQQMVKFIQDEDCKRILIYVNRVSDRGELLSVTNLKKNRNLFPANFQMDFLSAATGASAREKIFQRFRKVDNRVHIIVSCRTLSVGVDLVTCDAVCFAGSSKNAAECTQRVCRPVRLTAEERASGQFEKAKIFFPVNASSGDFCDLRDAAARNEAVHKAIRGHPLEVQMTILEMLKESLEVEFDFSRDGVNKLNTTGVVSNEFGKSGGTFHGERELHVDLSFPYSGNIWEESVEEFAKCVDNMVVSMKRYEPVEGYFSISELEQNEVISNWMTGHGGKRPNEKSGNAEEKFYGKRVANMLERNTYDTLSSDLKYEPLRKHITWNQAVEEKRKRKDKGRDPRLYVYDEAKNELEQNAVIGNWMSNHNGKRPNQKAEDAEEKIYGTRLTNTLEQNAYDTLSSDPKYEPLRKHIAWNKALEKKKRKEDGRDPILKLYDAAQTELEQNKVISDWMTGHNGKRPIMRSEDAEEKVYGQRVTTMLTRNTYNTLLSDPKFEPLMKHTAWNQAVEDKKKREQKARDQRLKVYDDATNELEQIEVVGNWMSTHNGKRPYQKSEDAEEKVYGKRVTAMLGKNTYETLTSDPKYEPLRKHATWNQAVEDKKKRQEEGRDPVLKVYDDAHTELEQNEIISYWMIHHDGRRPKGKSEDAEEKVYGQRVTTMLTTNTYETLSSDPKYEPLRKLITWNQAVENKKNRKEKGRDPRLKQYDDAKSELEQNEVISNWMTDYEGKRPNGKAEDAEEKVYGQRITNMLKNTTYETLSSDLKYAPLSKHDSWNAAIERKKTV